MRSTSLLVFHAPDLVFHLSEDRVFFGEEQMTENGVDLVVIVAADEHWVSGAEFARRHLLHARQVVVHRLGVFVQIIPRVLGAAESHEPGRRAVLAHHAVDLGLSTVPVLARAPHIAEERREICI